MNDLCGCMACQKKRDNNPSLMHAVLFPSAGFRYACEVCGNKRCPHHSNHALACTGSNRPGQPGSDFA